MTRRFPFTIFLSAFLLFLVQPLVGRYILPWFGGGPAVWTTCMLFFQTLLLAGYAYAHWLQSRKAPQQVWIHVALLASSALFLPLAPRLGSASSGDPSLAIVYLLCVTVGGPYFLLASTGPLLQAWYSISQPDRSPWRLYALSNLGSFLALLGYPFLFEPVLRLRTQSWIWSGLYLCFALGCGSLAWQQRGQTTPAPERSEPADRPGWLTILLWLGLAAASSTVLLATTNQISQEIAVNPFLWVVPLSIYLLTFILTFESDRWYRRSLFAVGSGILAPVACAVMAAAVSLSLRNQLAVHLLSLFVVCMLCHGELARSRPAQRYLTAFYLTIAAGGAIGGLFVAIVAPRVFSEYGEFPLGFSAACLLGFAGWLRSGAYAQWTAGSFAVRVPLMALLLGGLTAIAAFVTNLDHPGVERFRNFYGILRVGESVDLVGRYRQLTHGSIRHGFQYKAEPMRRWPTSYYGPHSGVGIAITALDMPNRRIAVVGLGTGTLAAYGRPGDTFRFYEINPLVEMIARTRFRYLADTKARVEVVLGDARVTMDRELRAGARHDYDLIAVDAFSSDSIPLHLLTAECANLYRERLAPGGALLLHISNRNLDLRPVTRGIANYLGWQSTLFLSGLGMNNGETSAHWVLLTPSQEFIQKPGIAGQAFGWPMNQPSPILWTDDFASLWRVLKF